MISNAWDDHYVKSKSFLKYPDENLLRLLKKTLSSSEKKDMVAVDLGCGSGRHVALLHDMGTGTVIGTDLSRNGLVMSRDHFEGYYVQCSNTNIPFKNGIADFAIAWGSLHYADKSILPDMIEEIRRILKTGGYLFATLRSDRDTYLKRGSHLGNDVWITDLEDLKGTKISFYNKSEVNEYFSRFSVLHYGYSERSIMGDCNKVISHWIIQGKN